MTPGRYDAAGLPFRLVVAQALAVPVDRLIGLPDWVDKERFAIAAKAPDGPLPARAMLVMLTNLLKDRFKLTMHTETRELPIYNLVFARSDKRFGPSLTESSAECRAALAERLDATRRGNAALSGPVGLPGCQAATINPGPGVAGFNGSPIAMLATILTQSVGRPVIDKTGLTSFYNFTLKWTPEVGTGALTPFGPTQGGPSPPVDPDATTLFTAVQEQLGLTLENARGPVNVVVIDRLEKPTLD